MFKNTVILSAICLMTVLSAQNVLPAGFQRHASLSLLTETNIYRIGGHFAFDSNAMARCPLTKDGIPDGKMIRQPLLIPDHALYQPAAVIANDCLYIVGGVLQDRKGKHHPLPGIIRYTIDKDGNLTDRKIFGSLPDPKSFGSATVVSGKYILLLGGYNQRNCYAAEILENKELGPWKKLSPLTSNVMAERRCIILKNKIFVCGSAGHKLPSVKLYVAELGNDGLPGKWRRSTNIPCTNCVMTSDGINGLLLFDGKEKKIYHAELDSEGELGDWTQIGDAAFPGNAPFIYFEIIRLKNGKFLAINSLCNTPRKFMPAAIFKIQEPEK